MPSKTSQADRKPLTAQEIELIRLYCRGETPRQAAIHAGFPEGRAAAIAYRLISFHPDVPAAIAAYTSGVKEALHKAGDYDVKAAMEEADKAIAFAVSTRNATAYVRGVELRAKLGGLLDPKDKAMGSNNFQINITGVNPPKVVSKHAPDLVQVNLDLPDSDHDRKLNGMFD